MKFLFIVLSVFLSFSSKVTAASPVSNQIEKINVNVRDHEMAVSFLGLSEGEATLIQGPSDNNILVNTGGNGTRSELEDWLNRYNVDKLNTLILTNDFTEISYELINELISKYKIKEIIATTKLADQLAKNLTTKMTITNWQEGSKTKVLPEATATVQYAGVKPKEGLDFMLEFFNHRIFFMTSCSERAEQVLLKKNVKDVHVFKLPKYTKESPISETLIHYLNPQISVLFAAAEYGPNPDVLYDLNDTWSEIYYTKRHGTITIKFTETKFEVITIPVTAEE